MGAANVGLKHLAVIEWDSHSCKNIRENQQHGMRLVKDWPLIEGDVRDVNFSQWAGSADLVFGGPPCQPFSIGGKQAGRLDDRDMFPQAVRAVREIHPRAFVLENVKGIMGPKFTNYVNYIRLQLAYPEIARKRDENQEQHFRRLQEAHSSNCDPEPAYQVQTHILNAANYGVPQKRERVFMVGFRRDVQAKWSLPVATHSKAALIHDKLEGDYWDRHGVAKSKRPAAQLRLDDLDLDIACTAKPWMTTRDAIADLGEPGHSEFSNHIYQPGARVYPGHTGSLLDMPAKTLKAGGHGVPGGENMVVLDSGDVRYFTVRESARLQTFPDQYGFYGSWTENMRQLGNAVPCKLAQKVVSSVVDSIRPSA